MIELPSPEPDLYPVLAGPATFYPAEADVPESSYVRGPRNPHVASGDWLGYFQDRARQHAEADESLPERPVPEHTTRDPWPTDLKAPGGAERFRLTAEDAGWEARTGYTRSWRDTVGRGAYRLTHHVIVQARRGEAMVWARWKAPVVEGKLNWTFDSGAIGFRPVETLKLISATVIREKTNE